MPRKPARTPLWQIIVLILGVLLFIAGELIFNPDGPTNLPTRMHDSEINAMPPSIQKYYRRDDNGPAAPY